MQNLTAPAHLWILPQEVAPEQVTHYLQTIFCSNQTCTVCSTCMQIRQQNYYACHWFNPENSYTLDLLQPFFSTISRSLDHGKKFFFIFFHADYFSHACVNSLLKSIEEPPPGYHFIFVASQLTAVMPTLRSRCIIQYSTIPDYSKTDYALLPFFTTNFVDPELFLKTLDATFFDDRLTLGLLNALLEYWLAEYKKNSSPENNYKIACIKEAFEKLPMPGSAKMFWKNLFLKMH
jgi:hypothetical protein